MKQSLESFRSFGPYARCPIGTTTRARPDFTVEELDGEEPPSSSGPPGLRGEALASALAVPSDDPRSGR